MKRYIVFYIDWFNHEPKSEEIMADSATEAMIRYAKYYGYDYDYAASLSEEELKQHFFDSDCMVHAHEVI